MSCVCDRHRLCTTDSEAIRMTDDELKKRFDHIDQRFHHIDQRFDDMNRRFASKQDLHEMRHQFEAFVEKEAVATRRHFDVVAESMKAEGKLIAEGHGALADGVNSLKGKHEELDGRQESLEVRQLAL